MKVLIYGANGWIGNQFIELIKKTENVYIIGLSRVDNIKDVSSELTLHNPSHVVSFIGRTHGTINSKKYNTIDYLEEPGKLIENVRDNLFSPMILAELCRQHNIHYTYLGTGCIFTSTELQPEFYESSTPNFFGSSYSVVKGYTDQLMSLYPTLNLRIRMPITCEPNKRNFITKITSYKKICSIANSMSVLPELLPVMIQMMEQNVIGTYNFTNPGTITHNEILEMYKEIVDPTFKWSNFSLEEQRLTLTSDRSNNSLNTDKLLDFCPITNIKDSVRNCLIEYKKKNKNLLITGGCGFIGSNFINYYFPKNKFNKIVNIDAMYYCASKDNIDKDIQNNSNYVFIEGNLCNYDIPSLLSTYNITHIIHFAAQSHVQNSFNDSIQFTYDNVLGTHKLINACKHHNVQKFVHVSTDEVYGESMLDISEPHKTEHSVLCPTNPYAATKAGAELIVQSYHHSYNVPVIITRGNNVFGKNQYPEKLIPKFIKLLKEDKKVTIQGDGSNVRSFLHVMDTIKAFEIILEKGEIGEIYNIGCDNKMEYSVLEIATLLIQKIKNEDCNKWIEYVEDRPFNDKRYYISNDKLKSLGWTIEYNLKESIDELI
jgi:dTDP-glucose 4,6-dehydratase